MPISLMRNETGECFGEDNACMKNTMKACKIMCFDFFLKPSSSQLNQTFYDMKLSKWNQAISILGRNCVMYAIWFCTEFFKSFLFIIKTNKLSFFVSGQNHHFYNNTKYLQLHVRRKVSVSSQPTKRLHYQHVSFQKLKRYNTAEGFKFNAILGLICYGFDVYFTC
jgi:hypothetical protein